MAIETKTYARKSFDVEAVQVTDENINEVAEWCKAQVYTDNHDRLYVKAAVFGANGERQTRAYVGDWVLKAQGKRGQDSFKMYSNNAFVGSFDLKTDSDA